MKTLKKYILIELGILAFSWILSSVLFAQSGSAFLSIGSGARAMAMGSAYSAVTNDVYSLHWNPAGLSFITKNEAAGTHAELPGEISQEYMAVAHPFGRGAFAVGASYFDYGSIEGRSDDRSPASNFAARDLVIQTGLGWAFSNKVRAGATVKFFQSRIADESSKGIALDAGVMKNIFRDSIRLGAGFRNLGPSTAFRSESRSLPFTLFGGAGYSWGPILLSSELTQEMEDSRSRLSFGAEYQVLGPVAVRAGRFLPVSGASSSPAGFGNASEPVSMDGFCTGLGLKLGAAELDYAFNSSGILGSSHHLSLKVKFGK